MFNELFEYIAYAKMYWNYDNSK